MSNTTVSTSNATTVSSSDATTVCLSNGLLGSSKNGTVVHSFLPVSELEQPGFAMDSNDCIGLMLHFVGELNEAGKLRLALQN
jgi:hypothetical protein